MSTTNKLTAPAQVAAPVTYADVVKSAQTLKLSDVCDVKTFEKMPEHLKQVIYTDLVKRVNLRISDNLGSTLSEIQEEIEYLETSDVIKRIRELMADIKLDTVNFTITAEKINIVKSLNKPASTRAVGTGTKSSKYTYYLNDNMIVGGSSDVATSLGIDVTTDQYKKANGWLKIAVQAKAQGATITRTNADNDTIEQFAPEATTKEAHAVWFAKQ